MLTHPVPSTPVTRIVRHDLKRRQLTVRDHAYLTPNMIRIMLTGPDLQDFVSLSPDDHVKLFIPGAEKIMRDYTPRRYSSDRQELVLDFAIHEAGPATEWAINARAGDTIEIGGPRGSKIISGDIPHWVLIGDETALPAIGRRLEEASVTDRFTVVVSVPGPDDRQEISTQAAADITWLAPCADSASRDEQLLEHVRQMTLPEQSFIWIAAEALLVRKIRAHLLDERQHPKTWLKASGYWVRGNAGATEKFE